MQRATQNDLCRLLGRKTGTKLYEYALGRDSRPVKTGSQRPKSIGVDLTYAVRFSEESAVLDFISKIATEVHNRLKGASAKGKKA